MFTSQQVDNMSGHGHSHGGGACGDEHDHDDISDAARGNLFSLYIKIDLDRVTCLNEAVDGSGKEVFKPWDKRLDLEKVKCTIYRPPIFLLQKVIKTVQMCTYHE